MTVITVSAGAGPAPALPPDRSADWHARAACADEDPELFFPDRRLSTEALQQAWEAKRVCASCPVMAECGRWAQESGQRSGVWGGVWVDQQQLVDEKERRKTWPQEDPARRHARRERERANLRAAMDFAVEHGTELLLAVLRGEREVAISRRFGMPLPAVRRALGVLTQSENRRKRTALERVLGNGDRLVSLVSRGCTDLEIARLLHSKPGVAAQARKVLAHRAAAARQYAAAQTTDTASKAA